TGKLSAVWVLGALNFAPDNLSNWDIEEDIKKSPLWPYCQSAPLWRCPADRSTVIPSSGPLAGHPAPRVRTMAMNGWGGGNGGDRFPHWATNCRVFLRLGDMIAPGPSRTWLLIDQREDAINPTAEFDTEMKSYLNTSRVRKFFDYPAMHHNNGASLSFADGHVESKHWLDPRTTPPPPLIYQPPTNSPNNPDIFWLQERATAPQ